MATKQINFISVTIAMVLYAILQMFDGTPDRFFGVCVVAIFVNLALRALEDSKCEKR